MIRTLAIVIFITCITGSTILNAQMQKPVTLESLLWEMVNLTTLTYFPDPAYSAKQSSSYDRATKSKDQGWYANNDRGQYIAVEKKPGGGKENVLLDAKGPGVVTRIWTANAQDGGTIRVYIDGNAEPAIEEKMTDLLGGSVEPFSYPFAGRRAKGWNLYYPIPYAKSCKITIDGESIYYQVGYRTYGKDAAVESFTMSKANRLKAVNERLITILKDPAKEFKVEGQKKLEEYTIPPGRVVMIHETNTQTPVSIREIRLRIKAPDIEKALRGCILIGDFDSEKKPTIWCPVGDFFGTAPGINTYNSLPLTVKDDGIMMSRWEMPFQRRARLGIRNTTSSEVKVQVYVMMTPYKWSASSMLFHAKWKKEKLATRPMSDWNYVNTKGPGVFVGGALQVLNPNPTWWGEGDEKIFVDGESFPSHFGTGTEDYYGYAWCSSELFRHAYHNQTRVDGPGNQGNSSINRFHIIDAIPFKKSFKFDMEVWHWKECDIVYTAVSYWYSAPGTQDVYKNPPASAYKVDEL